MGSGPAMSSSPAKPLLATTMLSAPSTALLKPLNSTLMTLLFQTSASEMLPTLVVTCAVPPPLCSTKAVSADPGRPCGLQFAELFQVPLQTFQSKVVAPDASPQLKFAAITIAAPHAFRRMHIPTPEENK